MATVNIGYVASWSRKDGDGKSAVNLIGRRRGFGEEGGFGKVLTRPRTIPWCATPTLLLRRLRRSWLQAETRPALHVLCLGRQPVFHTGWRRACKLKPMGETILYYGQQKVSGPMREKRTTCTFGYIPAHLVLRQCPLRSSKPDRRVHRPVAGHLLTAVKFRLLRDLG